MLITIKLALLNSIPLLITALGASFSENVGISNLGLEGSIVIGAFSSAIFSYYFSNAWIGLGLSILIVLVLAIFQSYLVISIKAEQVMAGTAYNLLMSSASIFILKSIFKVSGNSPSGPLLPNLFSLPILSYFIFIIVFISYFLIDKIFAKLLEEKKNHLFVKYISFILSNLFAAFAGIYLSIGRIGYFNPNLSGGRGFIALAVTSLANNNSFKILGIIILFGITDILQYFIEIHKLSIPSNLVFSFPYIFTLFLLIFQNVLKRKNN